MVSFKVLFCFLAKHLGAIHMETLLSVNARFASFSPTVHMDPVNAVPENAPGVKMEKSENAALVFSCGQQIRPTPRPLSFDLLTLRRLITTRTTMMDYMLAFMPQKILSLLGLLRQNLMLLCHYAERKRIMDNWLAIFIFFLLNSVSLSTVCLYTERKLYAHAPSLLLRFWWISSPTHRPGIWTTTLNCQLSTPLHQDIIILRENHKTELKVNNNIEETKSIVALCLKGV